jgi:hypothetical protein
MAAVQHGGHVSMRGNTFTGDFGANLLEGIPENAIVLSEGDLFHNAFYYQQVVLGKRPDLEFVDQQKLTYPWYVNQVRRRGRMELPDGMTFYSADPATHTKSWLDLNIRERGRPVVAVTVKDQSWFPEYRLVPMGLWYHVLPVESLPALAEQAAAFEKVAASWNLRSLNKEYHDRSWEAAERPLYARALGLLAGTLDLAEDLATGRTDFVPDSHAASWLERAGSVSGGERDYVPAAHVEVYHRAIAEQMDLSAVGGAAPVARKALAIAERALVENPRNVAVLKSQVALLRAFPESMDKGRELEIRGRIADLVPGDVNEVAAYVQLAIDLLNDPALRNVVDRGALVRRQEELVRRLELAAKVSRDPLLEKQRDQWREYLSRTRSMPG